MTSGGQSFRPMPEHVRESANSAALQGLPYDEACRECWSLTNGLLFHGTGALGDAYSACLSTFSNSRCFRQLYALVRRLGAVRPVVAVSKRAEKIQTCYVGTCDAVCAQTSRSAPHFSLRRALCKIIQVMALCIICRASLKGKLSSLRFRTQREKHCVRPSCSCQPSNSWPEIAAVLIARLCKVSQLPQARDTGLKDSIVCINHRDFNQG